MKLFEEFSSVSKEEWLEKVSKDLKGRAIEELNITIADGQVVSPFYHSDDVSEEISIPSKSLKSVHLGYSIELSNSAKDNELILEQLEGGANFLSLAIGKNYTPDLDVLFSGVLLDLIHVVIQLDECDGLRQSINEYVKNNYKSGLSNLVIVDQSNIDIVIKTVNLEKPESTKLLLERANNIFESKKLPKQIFLKVGFGHNYIENITNVLAHRLLWANMAEAHHLKHDHVKLIVEAYVEKAAISSGSNKNMISFSQIAMSMIAADVDVIFLPSHDCLENEKGEKSSRRYSQNIFNLMTMEGHLGKVESPTRGSYLFEKVAADIAESSWDKFVKSRADV